MINPLRFAIAAALLVSVTANAAPQSAASTQTPTLHANGKYLNGLVFNGIRFNGLTFNGLTFNGLTFNGLVFNGLVFNGVNLNGKFLNGLVFNGVNQNGWSLNGRSLNGWSLNGWMLDGRLHPSDGAAAPAIAAVPFYQWKAVATNLDWSALPLANVHVRLPHAP